MHQKKNKLLRALVTVALATLCAAASAEKADRDKPVNIESDRMNADDAKRIAVFEGGVVLTQGTLNIHADRLVVRQDDQGFQSGTATGSPATFKQKREGFNEYVEGEADRIEYNGKADKVEFFNSAHLKRDCGDDVRGNYISYDSRTETFTVNNAPAVASSNSTAKAGDPKPGGRVSVIMMPKGQGATPSTPCQPAKPAADARAQ